MTIDPDIEDIITLGEACRLIPPQGIAPCTMARWIQRGVRGVVLETVIIGGRRLTSREALQRFFSAQNADQTPAPSITSSQRQRQSEAARRELEKMGI